MADFSSLIFEILREAKRAFTIPILHETQRVYYGIQRL
jgi:hypothetical protein